MASTKANICSIYIPTLTFNLSSSVKDYIKEEIKNKTETKRKLQLVVYTTCSPMQKIYSICIRRGCQAIYIQVRPLRKEKFNGRIHGLVPALQPGYMLLLDDNFACARLTMFKVVKFKDTHIEHIFTLNCFCVLLVFCCLCRLPNTSSA